MPFTSLQSSTFFDFDSYYNNGLSNGAAPTGTDAPTDVINVALMLAPVVEPAALLGGNWATRQKALAALGPDGVMQQFGADTNDYNGVINGINALAATANSGVGLATGAGYVSSQASRTVWVQLTMDKLTATDGFNSLFGTPLLKQDATSTANGNYYWTGNLGLNSAWHGVTGLWFDIKDSDFGSVPPATGPGQAALTQGLQGIGNGATTPPVGAAQMLPQQIAEFYNFPLAGLGVATQAIGLLEAGLGYTSPVAGQTFAQLLGAYRQAIGLDPAVTVGGVALIGAPTSSSAERSLDVGIATAVNPNSTLLLYPGSGYNNGANAEPFTAYQQAIWDTVNNPAVISSSEKFLAAQPSPGSPFASATNYLFMDAALHNITLLSAAGDGGSGYEIANGLTNASFSRASPFGVVVGGTSLSLGLQAAKDVTLDQYVDAALHGDPATLWQLVAGGLTATPTAGSSQWFIETVWNRYYVQGSTLTPGPLDNDAGTGGVDPTHTTPWYQAALTHFSPIVTSDGTNVSGHGVPDVSALASGNLDYTVPQAGMVGTNGDGGTSAATPLWASLIVQINAIFHDQGLPNLGYATDLLYIAAAIDPASYNDVTVGGNVSSFLNGGSTYLDDGSPVIPTGFGYYAGPGYDLTSGLGSPNGTVLARTLTAIAHSQWSFESVPDLIDSNGAGGWVSGADQTLLLQASAWGGVNIGIGAGAGGFGFFSPGTAAYAWTSRFAGQALQSSSFDSNLVTGFDGQGQGALSQVHLGTGEALSVTVGGFAAQAYAEALTSSFGFADFQTAGGTVRVARPVAVAETVSGLDDQTAVLRVRQNGTDNLSVSFYKVDDFSGKIAGIAPGDAAYAAAAQARAYQLTSGGTSLAGPGYGAFGQSGLVNVDAGDKIAMVLTDHTTGVVYWAFAQGNESVAGAHVGHIWNYGLNTWGFEDGYNGGDGDYNDLVVQFDFTSSYGHGWLV